MFDVIIAGGGLSACLSGYLLKLKHPELKLLLLEAAGPHDYVRQTWSFQTLSPAMDPSPQKSFSHPEKSWFHRFIDCSWSGYDVAFPRFEKNFRAPYHSIRSERFHKEMHRALGPSLRSYERIVGIQGQRVDTASGQEYFGKIILDARGWPESQSAAGYQKFIGLNLLLRKPHGLTRPRLMDTNVKQVDGFRFFYLLPWSDTEILIEDTRYSNNSTLDDETIEEEILLYAERQGFQVDTIEGKERGALALPGFHAEDPIFQDGQLGVRAGLFHPTTGYSFYQAVQTAELISEWAKGDLLSIPGRLKELAERSWQAQEFYRRLNNMMFYAADSSERYRVLERFYEHDPSLIARFYAGKTSVADKVRILSGRPPISMQKAIYHFFNRQERLHEVNHA